MNRMGMSSSEEKRFLKALAQYLEELEQQDRFSGVVLVTQRDEQLFAGAYGPASRAWKIPNTLDTRFDTASITKLFTAAAILQLIDGGVRWQGYACGSW